MYVKGQGVPQDYKTEAELYILASKCGLGAAQYELGLMYAKGQGVAEIYVSAVRQLKLSAKYGIASAQYYLGIMYDNRKDIRGNDQIAVYRYGLAANQGYAAAQFILGVMYAFGTGVKQKYINAYMWGKIAGKNRDKHGLKLSYFLAKKMSQIQVEIAQKLTNECIQKKLKVC